MEFIGDKIRALSRAVSDYMIACQYGQVPTIDGIIDDGSNGGEGSVIARIEWAHRARESLGQIGHIVARTQPDRRDMRETR